MSKIKIKEKTGTNFDLNTNSLTEKYYTILIIFKICICQLIAKILLKQRSLNQMRHYLTGHIQIIFLSEKLKYLITFKIKIFQFYDYNETKQWE